MRGPFISGSLLFSGTHTHTRLLEARLFALMTSIFVCLSCSPGISSSLSLSLSCSICISIERCLVEWFSGIADDGGEDGQQCVCVCSVSSD